jgi:N utilization substance protein B
VSARGKARKRALDVLFECDARGLPLGETLDAWGREHPLNPYTVTVVEGVAERQLQIDQVVAAYSEGWDLDRMPAVDRAVLRIGVFELLYSPDVPPEVAVAEAVRLATELSTDESPTFVNGLLSAVSQHRAEILDRAEIEDDLLLAQNGGGSRSDGGAGPVPEAGLSSPGGDGAGEGSGTVGGR